MIEKPTKTARAKAPVRAKAGKEPVPEKATAVAFLQRLRENASAEEARKYDRYFPPAAREPGDRFIGVRMGTVFELAKAFVDMELAEIEKLLESDIHEARAGAVSIMSKQYNKKKQTAERQEALYALYLRRHDRINAWDLVDLGAWYVVGSWLVEMPRNILYRLAESENPWERRTAILATFAFIREGDCDDTYAIAGLLMNERVEPVQKAVGWMLRTTGNDRRRLTDFLDTHAAHMPRPMLRAAIEKLDPEQRAHYLGLGKG